MGLEVSNNVDIWFDCDCNFQSEHLISCILANLVHTGNRYEIAISGSPTRQFRKVILLFIMVMFIFLQARYMRLFRVMPI